ncbi:hypothetical protein REPUB_Repub15cG0125800 [Reevesia pubescens]
MGNSLGKPRQALENPQEEDSNSSFACRGNVKKSMCPNCKQLFCFQCQTVWHAGYQCEESEQMRDINEVLFGQLVKRKKWTRCPDCGQCVERLLDFEFEWVELFLNGVGVLVLR